ncbi:MAG: 8-amino-7-oxononanoate synthase [Candidatus Ancaeobacter aquaticus]|nr:8-amino-7-oxononanoate synthase [Candidatus Ancaeobacter aquaticus]
MKKLSFLTKELEELEKSGLYRRLRIISSSQEAQVIIGKKKYLSFSSNNYLGLATHQRVKDAAIEAIKKYGCGAASSRLISGTMELHDQLEKRIALFEGKEAAILYPTGYTANVGTITSLVDENDVILLDRLNHASIIDAARLSKAKIAVYPHCDPAKLNAALKRYSKHRRKLVITDSVFSMDGDLAPLPQIIEVAKKHDAIIMIDEAHATGVLGENGRGASEYFRVEDTIDIKMGTLSKAVGGLGGFVVGSSDLIEFLRNKARSFIYTTALPPAVCAASIEALNIIEDDPERRQKYWDMVTYIRNGLKSMGYNTGASSTQIIPVIIGDEKKTMEISKFLYENNILAPGIRYPTVPKNEARVRLTMMATHSQEDIIKLLSAFEKIKQKFYS